MNTANLIDIELLKALGLKNEDFESYIYYPKLRIGAKGLNVQELKEALANKGVLSADEDTKYIYDKRTSVAVSMLQKQWGLEATGIADDAFQKRLYRSE